jgi:hypothetical protein
MGITSFVPNRHILTVTTLTNNILSSAGRVKSKCVRLLAEFQGVARVGVGVPAGAVTAGVRNNDGISNV